MFPISRALAAALVAGALFVATRRREISAPPALIDWGKVRSIAGAIARRGGPTERFGGLRAEYAEMVESSQRLIADYAREPLPVGSDNVYVFDRVEWLEA